MQKPLAHLHTQYNRELPWGEIDMDFMNLNQSAHGDREYGFIGARLRLNRKIVVGHWQDPDVIEELASWGRAAVAMAESRRLKIARIGGMNMREVAVTGGDRVEAQIQLGWSINGYGVGELVGPIAEVSDAEVDRLLNEYEDTYTVAASLKKRRGKARNSALRGPARANAPTTTSSSCKPRWLFDRSGVRSVVDTDSRRAAVHFTRNRSKRRPLATLP